MLDPQFCLDHDPHTIDPPPLHLHELQLLHPHRKPLPISHFNDVSSPPMVLWKSPTVAPQEIPPSSSSRKKKPASVTELSCESAVAISENLQRVCVCRICFKHFSTGRALGGHMRVHGPLYQSAGTKRKLDYAESMDVEVQHGAVDVIDSKYSDSSLSKNIPDEKGAKFEDSDASSASELDGEAVEDAHASEVNLHQLDEPKEFDREDDNADGMSANYGFHKLVDDDHLDSRNRNDLYKLRHKPKRSRRFVDDENTMDSLLAGQGVHARASVSSSLERSRVCSVCSKAFWSWKALFGHMRCHPEREWRGILPPRDGLVHEGPKFNRKKPSGRTSSAAISSEDEVAESDVEDRDDYAEAKQERHLCESREAVEEELAIMRSRIGQTIKEEDLTEGDGGGDEWNPCWPMAGKRSRRKGTEGKARSFQQASSPWLMNEEPAVTSESNSLVEFGKEEEEAHMDASNFLFMLAEAARKIEEDTEVRKTLLQPCPDGPFFSSMEDRGGKHEREALNSLDDAEKPQLASMNNVKYECSTCKKSFNSPQALGGHRASHRKMKGCSVRTAMADGSVSGEGDELTMADVWYLQERQSSQAHRREKKQVMKGHECSVCHRVFATGQALGGHKRRHYGGEKSTVDLSEEATSSKLDEGYSILDLNMHVPGCEREGTLASQERNGEGLSSSTSWNTEDDTLGDQDRRPWELEGRWPKGSAMAY